MTSDLTQSIILGIVQGLTEFLPVSSTAHLILLPWFFGWDGEVNSLTFDVALHAGTLLSLAVCFFNDWLAMATKNRRLLGFIVAASVPAAVAGILLERIVEHVLRSPLVIVFALVVFGVLMLVAERYSKPTKTIAGDDFSLADSIVIGIAQAIALIPGVSRSGITITAGLFRNLSRESAARFSFLLSTPVIFGATLLEGSKLLKNPADYHFDIFAVGFLSSFVSGLVAIKFLLSFLRHHPLNVFVYYRFLLAGLIVVTLFAR